MYMVIESWVGGLGDKSWLCKVLVKLDAHFSPFLIIVFKQAKRFASNLHQPVLYRAFLYTKQLFKHLAMMFSLCNSPDCNDNDMTESF